MFYDSKKNKKINMLEYEIIDYIVTHEVEISLSNEKYIELFNELDDAKYIYNYINILLNKNILIFDSNKKDRNEKNKINTLCIILTNKCNLNCRHCCQDSGTELDYEFTKTQWLEAIDKLLLNFEFKNVMISGGEPLTVDFIFELVSYLKEKNPATYTLMTNGLLINNKNINLIKKYFDHVSISLDGIDPETTKIIREKDVFQKIIDKVEFLKKENFFDISISAVLTKSDQIEDCFENLCNQLDVDPMIRELSLIGRGSKNMNFIERKYDEYMKNHEFYKYNRYSREYVGNLKRCGAAKEIITITPDGSIYPCNLLQNKLLKIGNINDFDIKKKVLFYDIHNKVREMINIKCIDCTYNCLCWSCYANFLSYSKEPEILSNRCNFRKKQLKKYLERID